MVEITDRERLALAGLELEVLHAPGHTEGSVMFALDGVPDGIRAEEPVDRTLVSGDVLFAGSIGRTDLPGGSHPAMLRLAAGRRPPAPRLHTRAHRPRSGHDDPPGAEHQPLFARIDRVSDPSNDPSATPGPARAAKVRPISGFPELLPAERLLETQLLDIVRDTFELHGFAPVETRAVEPVERLLGKGGDADKEIYGVSRLAGRGDERGRESELGLHFDLTVPFARYVLENAGQLSFPFRRYQIQKVWRGERPQEGRFREFTQADIDVVDVGELAPTSRRRCRSSSPRRSRGCPSGSSASRSTTARSPRASTGGSGSTDIAGTLRIVDKLDKIGPGAVAELLIEEGASEEQARQCLALAEIRSGDLGFVDQVRALGVSHPTLEEGLEALSAVIRTGMEQAPGVLVADLRIARGLDYYTGTVYETQLVGDEDWGSVCSGGRYDSLASDGRTTYPGVGHLDRVHPAGPPARRETRPHRRPVDPLVRRSSPSPTRRPGPGPPLSASALRARGIPCEVAPSAAKFGKQIRYADRRGIPFVWFPAAGERGDQVKDLRSGDQVDADPARWTPPTEDLRPRLVGRVGAHAPGLDCHRVLADAAVATAPSRRS